MNTLPADQPPSQAVLKAVAGKQKCDVLDLPPLYETISPEILDQIFSEPATVPGRALRFTYTGYTVTVESDGVVAVTVEPDSHR
jgi:hypothetical protein